jgi:hypothetical protein
MRWEAQFELYYEELLQGGIVNIKTIFDKSTKCRAILAA